jgi:hypothetical protein
LQSWISFIKSYWYLFYFYIMLRKKGLQKVLEKIESIECQRSKQLKLDAIISGFQSACNLHVFNVECLERSIALYYLLVSNHYECRLCLGIRRKPFLSHAWIETNIEKLDESENRSQFYVFLILIKRR